MTCRSEVSVRLAHTHRGYCVACGGRCTGRQPRRRRVRAHKPPACTSFTREDMALLRANFNEWKLRYHSTGPLITNPLFADGLRSLMLENGYGQTDVGLMLGVSRERVRQWANQLGIAREHSGSEKRLWDPETNRFVNVGMTEAYRQRLRELRPPPMDWLAKRRRIAGWVLRDLHDWLGRTPAHADLAEAYAIEPGALNGRLGVTTNRGPVREQLRALWASVGLEYRNYATGGRGRPERSHKPATGNPLPPVTRARRWRTAQETLLRLATELGRQPRPLEMARALGVRPGMGVSRWLTGRHQRWGETVSAIYAWDDAAVTLGQGGSQAPTA